MEHDRKKQFISKIKLYMSLFSSFFRISLFTLGGGAVMIPLMEEEFVKKKKLISEEDMLDIISLTNSLPGVIAINSSVLIGHITAGLIGSVVSLAGVLIPPFVIILLLAEALMRMKATPWIEALFQGVRAGVTALLISILVRLGKKTFTDFREYLLAAAAFLAIQFFQVNAVLVLLASGFLGLLLFPKKEEDRSL